MLIVAIVFLLLVVIFAVQNAGMVPIVFITWSFDLNLALVVLGAASIGAIVGTVWSWFRGIQSRGRVKELERQLTASQEKASMLERALADLMSHKDRVEVQEET